MKTDTAQFQATTNTLTATPSGTYNETIALANVTIMGVSARPSTVSFAGSKLTNGWSYDSTSKVLAVTQLDGFTKSGAWSAPWTLTWG